MAVFVLTEEISFPPPGLAGRDGLLAVGGDLSPGRLLAAYSAGIFPWYCEGEPILWWSPDPRLVLFPGELKISRSLRQTLNKDVFEITTDRDFDSVIRNCASPRARGGGGTWITPDMVEAYSMLHRMGHAHSVEARMGGELVGGLYGVSLGGAFFGESMFSLVPDSSKAALTALDQRLSRLGFEVIDCQLSTEHLKRMGAREIPRRRFLAILEKALAKPVGGWDDGGPRQRPGAPA